MHFRGENPGERGRSCGIGLFSLGVKRSGAAMRIAGRLARGRSSVLARTRLFDDEPRGALRGRRVDEGKSKPVGVTTMGELGEKIKGNTNEAIGETKESIGRATDNESLIAKGEAQETKGEAQKLKGEVEGALGNDV
ncbi:CsbD family protein [Sphingomicrobium astaxanthinifaciens]|uniref:CsbD family protein n=1 Tax=Sphingomicrobium astaxanthinifaciens TaxID=1227949 RepID=UPI00389ADE6F